MQWWERVTATEVGENNTIIPPPPPEEIAEKPAEVKTKTSQTFPGAADIKYSNRTGNKVANSSSNNNYCRN